MVADCVRAVRSIEKGYLPSNRANREKRASAAAGQAEPAGASGGSGDRGSTGRDARRAAENGVTPAPSDRIDPGRARSSVAGARRVSLARGPTWRAGNGGHATALARIGIDAPGSRDRAY